MEEKRLFQRILFSHEATLQLAGKKLTTHILDLSMHGCLCTEPTGVSFQIGQAVTLVLKLDDQHIISIELELIHKENQLLGFKNQLIDIDSISELKRLIQLNLGNDDLLSRDLDQLAR